MSQSRQNRLKVQYVQISQDFLLRYPLIEQKFKIEQNYIPIPQISSINKYNNKIVFKCIGIVHKDIQSKQNFCGIIFEENLGETSNIQIYNALFYQGQLNVAQLKQGRGKAVFDNGDTYEGEWNNDSIQGYGIYTQNQNKAIYQGQFSDWKKQGKGKLISNIDKGFTYEGQFKNNQIDGQGSIEFQDGSSYEGQFRNGFQDGYGTYRTKTMKYEGTWKNGLMCGAGTAIWYSPDGQIVSKYTGEYQQGKKHGFGEYVIENKKLMRGQWFEGKFTPGANSYVIQ